MLRSLIRVAGALAFALLLAPATPSAAPPPGIAYDEIVRVVVTGTPPPPGNFQNDLAALSASPAAVAATAAPRKHGLGALGALAGAVLSGNAPGAIVQDAASDALANSIEDSMQRQLGGQFGALGAALRGFLQPRLVHYAYWNGWERVEDDVAQTVTIRKCDMGRVIHLDLTNKTYTIFDPSSEPSAAPIAPAPRSEHRVTPAEATKPGTAVAVLSETTKVVGPLRIDNVSTVGYDATTSFAMTQSTGSCHDANASLRSLQYLSSLAQPTVNACPVRRAPPVPQTASDAFAVPPSGGCRPTFTMRQSGTHAPSGRLALYSLVSMSAAGGATPAPTASGASGIGFLTERGNVFTLGPADAGRFEIPPGFTKAP
jgi:hypothetical protein